MSAGSMLNFSCSAPGGGAAAPPIPSVWPPAAISSCATARARVARARLPETRVQACAHARARHARSRAPCGHACAGATQARRRPAIGPPHSLGLWVGRSMARGATPSRRWARAQAAAEKKKELRREVAMGGHLRGLATAGRSAAPNGTRQTRTQDSGTAGKSEGEKKGDKERRGRVNGAGRAGANASTPSGQAAGARGARAELGPRPSWWRRGDYIGHTYAGHRYIVMVQGRRRVGPRAHDHFAGGSARWLAVLCVRSRRGNGRECRAG